MNGPALFSVQIVMFVVLVLGVLITQWQIVRLTRRWAQDRQDAIEEVRRNVDAVAARAAVIAEELKIETLGRAEETAKTLDTKLEYITKRFDAIGRTQEQVVELVDTTLHVVERELNTEPDKSQDRVKNQISSIRTIAERIDRKIKDEKDPAS